MSAMSPPKTTSQTSSQNHCLLQLSAIFVPYLVYATNFKRYHSRRSFLLMNRVSLGALLIIVFPLHFQSSPSFIGLRVEEEFWRLHLVSRSGHRHVTNTVYIRTHAYTPSVVPLHRLR